MAAVTLRGIEKKLGGSPVLRGIDLDVPDGALVVLVGPSGCGKSTLLRTIAGLEAPDAGTIAIGERDVTNLAPRDRDIAMVFQSYALYPHMTVRKNLAFGLELRGEKREVVSERIAEVSRMLGLGALLERYPRQLSGGQRQRVAMGRALARRAQAYLLDEPLSNLDAALRSEVRVEIKRLHAELRATMIYVTHDQTEAMTLADVLVVLAGGRIEQVGPPLEVYARPSSRFVASFMGSPSMNFIDARVETGRVRADGLDLPCATEREGAIVVGIRPHDVAPGPGDGAITLEVDVVETMGFEAYAHGRVGAASFVARLEGARAESVRAGETLALTAPASAIHLFDPGSGRAFERVASD